MNKLEQELQDKIETANDLIRDRTGTTEKEYYQMELHDLMTYPNRYIACHECKATPDACEFCKYGGNKPPSN